MLEGTKRLFPTDYQDFKEAMISAANDDDLPVTFQLDNIKDFTLKDFQDFFSEFNLETSLDITGSFFLCHHSGKLHVQMEISRDEEHERTRILQ